MGHDRSGYGRTSAFPSSARGLGRFLFLGLLVGGVVLLVLVLAAVAIGVWLVINADAALAWLNGVLAQLQPIISLITSFPGSG